MLTLEEVSGLSKEDIPAIANLLTPEDVSLLVTLLAEKDDNLRYHALLLLQNRSRSHADVYPYWHVLVEKFQNANSYQRSIGLMLIADNVRWDRPGKFDSILDDYLKLVDDEKPVTVRQCVQSLVKVVQHKPHLAGRINEKLLSVDIAARKETQQKILLMDILSVFAASRKIEKDERVETYILNAMTGGKLDKKAKAEISKLLDA